MDASQHSVFQSSGLHCINRCLFTHISCRKNDTVQNSTVVRRVIVELVPERKYQPRALLASRICIVLDEELT